eukprot:g6604.t1
MRRLSILCVSLWPTMDIPWCLDRRGWVYSWTRNAGLRCPRCTWNWCLFRKGPSLESGKQRQEEQQLTRTSCLDVSIMALKFETDQQVMEAFDEVIVGVGKDDQDPQASQKVVLKKQDGTMVAIDSLDVSSNVKTLLKEIDAEGNGCVDDENVADMLSVMRTMKHVFGSKGSMSHSEVQNGLGLLQRLVKERAMNSEEMSYGHMPDCIQEVMKEWDIDRSGSVNVIELSAAAKAHKKVKEEGRMMRKIILVLFAVIVLLLVGMFVMSYIAVDMAKEMRGTSDGVMQNGDGETVKVGDRWLSVSSSNVLEVAESTPGRRLSSTVPDDYFKTLKHETRRSGAARGFRQGVLTLDDYILSADEAFTSFLAQAGMPNILDGDGLFGRRLSENSLLEGFFGKLKDVEWHCESVPLPNPEEWQSLGIPVQTYVPALVRTSSVTVKKRQFAMHPLQQQLSIGRNGAQARMERMGEIGYGCVAGLPPNLDVAGLITKASGISLVGFTNEGGRVLRQWRLQVESLPTDALTQLLSQSGTVPNMTIDYFDVDTDPTGSFESGQPYRVHAFAPSGGRPNVTLQYAESLGPKPVDPGVTGVTKISEVSDMDLAGALSYFGVTKLAADCEKDVFVAGKQPFITLAEEINQLARAENPQKVPKIDAWVEHPAVVSYNAGLLKDRNLRNSKWRRRTRTTPL